MAYSLTIPKAVVPLVSVSLSCTTYYMVCAARILLLKSFKQEKQENTPNKQLQGNKNYRIH